MAVLDAADRHPIDFHSLRWPALKAAAEALGRASLASGAASEAGAVRFLATDSPERFARVGAIFLGRPIDSASVELVDLRAL